LAAAYGLDLIAGDPESMPHPVRLIGGAITRGERMLRRAGSPGPEFLRGAALSAAVIAGSWAGAYAMLAVAYRAARSLGIATEILLAWTTLATGSLIEESKAVLASGDLAAARRRVARIVGRDTDSLDEPEVLRAVIETVAESLCDGVIAPLFYLAVGGVPLAFAYKAVNTLDSMIGHREPPYLYFGRTAARLDDVANLIPARLTAMAIAGAAIVSGHDGRHALTVWRRDGYKHPSPNAGQSEAAMAGALGVQLGGVSYYGGQPSSKPLLGAEFPRPARRDAAAALRIARVASVLAFSVAWIWRQWRGNGAK
jgi:adenosylcobinamide-phosphate synthase